MLDIEKKPSYVPESAWQQYLSYKKMPLYMPHLANDAKWLFSTADFFEKILFSPEAKYLWDIFPKERDTGNFIIFCFTSRIDSDAERQAFLTSKELKKTIPADIRRLKKDLLKASYVMSLHQFIHKNGTLQRIDEKGIRVDTDIMTILDELENFIKSASIVIYGTAYKPKEKAIKASRQRKDYVDFMRCLYCKLTDASYTEQDIDILIPKVLTLLYPIDAKDWVKSYKDNTKKMKLDP